MSAFTYRRLTGLRGSYPERDRVARGAPNRQPVFPPHEPLPRTGSACQDSAGIAETTLVSGIAWSRPDLSRRLVLRDKTGAPRLDGRTCSAVRGSQP
jgi:hypothetical protein